MFVLLHLFLIIIICSKIINGQYCYANECSVRSTLTGDVQNWALLIQNYILKLASDSMHREKTQSFFDLAEYKEETKSGEQLLDEMKTILDGFFEKKQRAAHRIAEDARDVHDKLYRTREHDYLTQLKINSSSHLSWRKSDGSLGLTQHKQLLHVDNDTYKDADIPLRLPPNMTFHPHFKRNVSLQHSVVKISDEIPRNNVESIWTVEWTHKLEPIFVRNRELDPDIRWQYFGSHVGLIRLYPGREWDQNFAGFYNDYDPRVRPWYIGTTSGPKDVIIILDCSESMKSNGKFAIGTSIATVVINTLTRQDYVNIICAHESHWDDIGKWHVYKTEVLSCQQDTMVKATLAFKRDLKEKLATLKPGGTSEFETAFDTAFDLFQRKPKTGCQSILIFITDGQDTDGETVRCGAGQYTRSGYVPGPICKYNWTQYWTMVKQRQQFHPRARIFSYLVKDNGQIFPGKLACENDGHFAILNDGENLINKMFNYFDYLSKASLSINGSWTSQYIDQWGLGVMLTYAIPVTSNIDGRLLGVAGVDVTLDDIEHVLSSKTWGGVYGFLINRHDGDAIIHPGLKSTTIPIEDPISTHITQLEMTNNQPEEFQTIILTTMLRGQRGSKRLSNAYRATIRREFGIGTYYWSPIENTDYIFAFSLGESDEKFREVRQPKNLSMYDESFFNLLIEYNSTKARKFLPGKFEHMQVKINDPKYNDVRVSYLYSSIMLAPRVYCDPSEYFYNDDLAQKTINAHIYINQRDNKSDDDKGCSQKNAIFHENTRAYVLISQPIERVWRRRPSELTKDIIWTYVGMRTGVFRTYPAHRSVRDYDHTARAWYKRAVTFQDRTTASMPYLDLSGGGKVITIAQALFEGMPSISNKTCQQKTQQSSSTTKFPGGCPCSTGSDCLSGYCYQSVAPGPDPKQLRCATERIIGVTGTDISYNSFHSEIIKRMVASDGRRSCDSIYPCPSNPLKECSTRCYLVDHSGYLIVDPDFVNVSSFHENLYTQVTLGHKEGEVMADLIYKHGLFHRAETITFQGTCHVSKPSAKVTLKGIPANPEELDNKYKNKGPIPQFMNEYGCIQDQVRYKIQSSKLKWSDLIIGEVNGPCMSGQYYVTPLVKTNLILVVIENYYAERSKLFYNFNCKIQRSIVDAGAFRIINGTCAHKIEKMSSLYEESKCPVLRDVQIECKYNGINKQQLSLVLVFYVIVFYRVGFFLNK
ncbi:unnamed protein product [Rotaria sp. Silwood2]|nr:unnamed protein product [Rotaria sp. Silwood2]CAF2602054.1 unnamed protein product [Rotaria sp. Silwood2]CAF2828224.1 unnamed protein product [Rotaria sp. Silwood2]CAF2972792.1 unnamed protein product [Rotaria sp. Silwood2]CAF3939410.1 unnamed protein product [Rotaria sp. Silwood2]